MASSDRYSTLYDISMRLAVNVFESTEIIEISRSDIISISIINQYDNMTYPIIRVRLYSDLSILEKLTTYSDSIMISMNMDAGIYRMGEEGSSPVQVSAGKSISINLNCYIQNKNTPTSFADQYPEGIKKDSSLNTNNKVPIELYCYDELLIHHMRKRVPSIWKNMSLDSIIQYNLPNRFGDVMIDPLINPVKYDQILIPNLNVNQMLSFFDNKYGLYKKGSQVYSDIGEGIHVCNTDVNNISNGNVLSIYVNSYKNNSDMGGMKRLSSNEYMMSVKSNNVSVLSITDIERTLNTKLISAIDLNTLSVDTNELTKLYENSENNWMIDDNNNNLFPSLPTLLHKTLNPYVLDMVSARIIEKMTKIDISGVGFDIGKMNINTRYNLTFESPIRGAHINQFYRANSVSHVILNLNSRLFIAQTVMNLCSN